MSPRARHKLVLSLIALCSFIHSVISDDNDNPHQQHIELINSLSSVSTSFVVPISLTHSEWLLSNSSNSHSLITLESFLNSLTIHHSQPSTLILYLQIDTIQTQNTDINSCVHKLKQIISANPIHISENIITSQYIPLQILQTISDQNLSIAISINTHLPYTNQILFSNHTQITEIENYICKPWPIYLGFFAGIGVTVIITWVISLTTGEKDTELYNGLTKLVGSGNKYDNGGVEVSAPIKHKKARTSSAILLFNSSQLSLSPKSRSLSVVQVLRKGSSVPVQGSHNRKHSTTEPSWAADLNIHPIKHRKSIPNLSTLKPLDLSHINSIEEEEEKDIQSSDSNDNTETEPKYEQLSDHRRSLVIHTNNNFLSVNDVKLYDPPINADITPKSDIYTQSSGSDGFDISISELNGQKSQDSESDLTETNDSSPIRVITEEKKCENIDLSPIVESVVHFEKFRNRQQRYRINRQMHNTMDSNGYIKRLSGKSYKVGFKKSPVYYSGNNDKSEKDTDTYDCLGTSSENSETVNGSEEMQMDTVGIVDDGLDGYDGSGIYSEETETDSEEEVP